MRSANAATLLESLLRALEAMLERPYVLLEHREEADGEQEVTGEVVSRLGLDRYMLPGPDGWKHQLPRTVRALGLPPACPILYFPPWTGRQRRFPGFAAATTPGAFALRTVLEQLPQYSLTALLPASMLTARSSTDRVAALVRPPVIVVGIDEAGAAFGAHPSFAVGMLHFNPARQHDETTKFFKATGRASVDEMTDDFSRLLRQRGGLTEFGFVRRQTIPVDQPLWPDRWSPLLERKLSDLEAVGQTALLGEFAELFYLLHRQADSHLFGEGVPVLRGRHVTSGGVFVMEEHDLADASEEKLLRAGDILVPSVQRLHRGGSLKVARVEEHHLPATADQTVVAVRLREDLDALTREFVLAFLRSHMAAVWIRSRGPSLHVTISDLAQMPVPIPDNATKSAIGRLRDTRVRFEGWADEARMAVDDLFRFVGQNTASARTRLFQTGDVLQRRVEAAEQTGDLHWQIRNLYPHPIAYCFRTVEAVRDDVDGFRTILRCAEMSMAYLAFAAMAVVRETPDLSLSTVDEIRRRIEREGGYSLGFGDFIQVVREFSGRNSRTFRRLDRWVPLEEIREAYDDDVDAAVRALKERRDAFSHFRDEAAPSDAVARAREELETLLRAMRFLTEYPLLQVDDVRVNAFRGVTVYAFRQLQGDHPVVPQSTDELVGPPPETGSLYLRNRQGELHILRPYILRFTCPTCGRLGIFHVDRLGNDSVSYRSFDHGHSLELDDQVDAARTVGLLPSS